VSIDLHNHLRRLIIENQLPPGEVLKQAQLARAFGVSRTPMREAFRMLQEEGLIDAEIDQRARVRDLDPNELDQLYSVRILLESLGVRLTAHNISEDEVADARAVLGRMEAARTASDMDAWVKAHRTFHRLCVARADEPLTRVIDSYSERSERYLRLYQILHPQSFDVAHEEHEGILESISGGDADEAGARMASHLAHTSLTVLKDVAPELEGTATLEALGLARARVRP
jgi:DNA-binding GntR family transcriptional regulator